MPPYRKRARLASNLAKIFKWKRSKRTALGKRKRSSVGLYYRSSKRSKVYRPYTRRSYKRRAKSVRGLAKKIALSSQPKSIRNEQGNFWLVGNSASGSQGMDNTYIVNHVFNPTSLVNLFNDLPVADVFKKRVYLGQFWTRFQLSVPFTFYTQDQTLGVPPTNPKTHPPVEVELYCSTPKDDITSNEVGALSVNDPISFTNWIKQGFVDSGWPTGQTSTSYYRRWPITACNNMKSNFNTRLIKTFNLKPGQKKVFKFYSKYYRSLNVDEVNEADVVAYKRLSKIYWVRFRSQVGTTVNASGEPYLGAGTDNNAVSYDVPYMILEHQTQYRYQMTDAITPTVTFATPSNTITNYGGQVSVPLTHDI